MPQTYPIVSASAGRHLTGRRRPLSAALAREMGHESTEHNFRVYGGWVLEEGDRAATLRESWADGTTLVQDTPQTGTQLES